MTENEYRKRTLATVADLSVKVGSLEAKVDRLLVALKLADKPTRLAITAKVAAPAPGRPQIGNAVDRDDLAKPEPATPVESSL